MANSHIAKHMVFYPELNPKVVSGGCDTKRWREMDRSILTPMARIDKRHFFVDELALLDDNALVIPLMWYTWSSELHAECHPCSLDEVSPINFARNVSHSFIRPQLTSTSMRVSS